MHALTITVPALRVLHTHVTRTPFRSVRYRNQPLPLLALSRGHAGARPTKHSAQ